MTTHPHITSDQQDKAAEVLAYLAARAGNVHSTETPGERGLTVEYRYADDSGGAFIVTPALDVLPQSNQREGTQWNRCPHTP